MSSHCIVPNWNLRNQIGQEQVEGEREESKYKSFHVGSSTNVVPMPNYDLAELTWENGQLTMHGLGELLPTTTTAKPTWTNQVNSSDTLESMVLQATLCNTKQNQTHHHSANGLASAGEDRLDQVAEAAVKKRGRSDLDWPSMCASAIVDRDNDTTMMSWASYESPRSLKMTKTGDKDNSGSLYAGSETQEEEQKIKAEGGQSRTRRNRAAAIHNESERKRRDRINHRMRTLQKLVPNASKTDKVSILDDVIKYLKQLQAQIQLMSMRTTMPPQLVVPPASSSRLSSCETVNVDLYNKMAAAIYGQHSNQTTQVTGRTTSRSNREQGD